MTGQAQCGKSGSQTETFEHLVEDDDDEESCEILIDGKCETDDDRVENHTDLQDCHTDQLSGSFSSRSLRIDRMIICTFEILVLLDHSTRGGCDVPTFLLVESGRMDVELAFRSSRIHIERIGTLMIVRMSIRMVVCVRRVVYTQPSEFGRSNSVCRNFSKEDSIDGSHGDSRCPVVFRPSTRETFRSELIKCRCEKMNERGGYDDS